MHNLFAYTDGACSGNPGPGGWGVLLVAKKQEKIITPGTVDSKQLAIIFASA